MSFAVGSLVRARGREWVVLPESSDEMIVARPLGGGDDEIAGIYRPLETVEPASFSLPDPTQLGDHRSCRLLRDALRLGFRSSAGPFRSFAHLAVEPRPYQLVPLLVGLKLDPVRLLIADDVGIGKTVEASLLARELIDRGEVERFTIVCPPQIAEQWQAELSSKFHLDAELVLPGTATRLERHCRLGQSIFERYRYTIVSTDFIKSDRRRDDFLRACPELVIIDEAHTCAWAGEGRGTRHQRHTLAKGIAADPKRHVILVTATPHSGNETAFRSLLSLLNPEFTELPDDLSGSANEHHRRRLAAHFVQRRRGDIRHYMQSDTPFPEREEAEETYKLSADYKKLFVDVLKYARETVADPSAGIAHRQRVRWWSALALLRSFASSPAAAAATLRTRASTADTENADEADTIGRRTVFDLVEEESAEAGDLAPGSDPGEDADDSGPLRSRLLRMARAADALQGKKDAKLQKAITLVETLLRDGFRPILFCRFIPTAEYVAAALRDKLRGVEVVAVTGNMPPVEREERVAQLAKSEKRVLVCTDCLSEGINLQQPFNAVLHYDLSWNPTRHEQREGRVDRYGQPTPIVRTLTYYGIDNQIDGIVLDVLLRKHKAIRNSLGISVPVPTDSDQVIQAVFEGLLLRGKSSTNELLLPGMEEFLESEEKKQLHQQWDASTEREKRSRTVFAQETIKVEEVTRELTAAREAIGSGVDVASFTQTALQAYRAVVRNNGVLKVDLSESPRALRDMLNVDDGFDARFEPPVSQKQLLLTRTHPVVEKLANHVLNAALDPLLEGVARRCGVIRTGQVTRRTTVLLVRYRFHIITVGQASQPDSPPGKADPRRSALLAEDSQVIAFAGSPANAEWLPAEHAEALLLAEPESNVLPDQAAHFVRQVIDGFASLQSQIEQTARDRADKLLDAHSRVRDASRAKHIKHHVEPQLPPDVLGIYVYLPKG